MTFGLIDLELLINPRLTKGGGGCCNPLTESYQGHLGNLFYILCGHFH